MRIVPSLLVQGLALPAFADHGAQYVGSKVAAVQHSVQVMSTLAFQAPSSPW